MTSVVSFDKYTFVLLTQLAGIMCAVKQMT